MFTCDYILYSIYKVNNMIIKIDNRETTLIPLIEQRFEIFMNSDTNVGDIHDGVDDGIEEEGISNNNKSFLKNKKIKEKKSIHTNPSSCSGCLVPLHIFTEVEIDVTQEVVLTSRPRSSSEHSIKKEQLAVGDIILEDDKGQTIIIFERKTLYDLAASIRDGRYNEQSFRLDKENIHNHNIIYIIEGDIERYIEKKGRVSKKTLISCMFSLLYYKGFSVFRTNSICETADIVVFFADKYYKTTLNNKSRMSYYTGAGAKKHDELNVVSPSSLKVKAISEDDDSDENEKYCAALKSHKEKNDYITPDNINIIMLTCVPGISSKVATQLMREYKTIQNLLYQLQKTPDILNTFMIKTETGGASPKTTFRKINKTSVENIKKFLITNAIVVNT
jgi:ERCC4-type nuclease